MSLRLRHTLLGRLGTALLALVVLFAGSGPASAEKKDKRAEAKQHYENGLRKFDIGKYDDAADEFVEAYELVGDPPNILYNIAQAYRLGEKFEKSAQFYRSFLRKVPDVSNRQEIEGRIVEMDERAADQKRQADRRATEQAAAERREAARRAELLRQAQRKTQNDGNRPVTGPEPPPRNDVTPDDDRPKPGRTLKIVGYALCGLTAAALGVGIAMTVLAVRANKNIESASTRGDVFDTGLRDTESHGQVYDKVQIVGYSVAGAAAIGAGVAIYFGFRAEKLGSPPPEDPAPSASRSRRFAWPVIAPCVDRNGGGLVVLGRF